MQSSAEETRHRAQKVWSAVLDAAGKVSTVRDAVRVPQLYLGVLDASLAEAVYDEAVRLGYAVTRRADFVTEDPVGHGYIRIIGFRLDVDRVHVGWQYDVPATAQEYAEYCQEERERQRASRQEARP